MQYGKRYCVTNYAVVPGRRQVGFTDLPTSLETITPAGSCSLAGPQWIALRSRREIIALRRLRVPAPVPGVTSQVTLYMRLAQPTAAANHVLG